MSSFRKLVLLSFYSLGFLPLASAAGICDRYAELQQAILWETEYNRQNAYEAQTGDRGSWGKPRPDGSSVWHPPKLVPKVFCQDVAYGELGALTRDIKLYMKSDGVLHPSDLEGLSRIRRFEIEHTEGFKKWDMEESLFRGMTGLEYLGLRFTSAQAQEISIPEKTFDPLLRIGTLMIYADKLTLENGVLGKVPSLRTLQVGSLANIPEHLFDNLPYLRELHLRTTSPSGDWPQDLFANLKAMQNLDFWGPVNPKDIAGLVAGLPNLKLITAPGINSIYVNRDNLVVGEEDRAKDRISAIDLACKDVVKAFSEGKTSCGLVGGTYLVVSPEESSASPYIHDHEPFWRGECQGTWRCNL